MKSEHEIAKENVEEYNKTGWVGNCIEHLASCQREEIFLKNLYGQAVLTIGTDEEYVPKEIDKRLKDNQTAIKIYSDEGIK